MIAKLQLWLAGNALRLGGIAALCIASFFYGCDVGKTGEQENTRRVQKDFDAFADGVRKAGDKAEAERAVKERADRALKEKIDEDYKRALAESRDRANRMLIARARGGYLPSAATVAGSIEGDDSITFDRAELERSIQRLDERVSAIVAQGDEKKAKLDAAVKWAAEAFPAAK